VPAEIQADERLLRYIFANLLTNAVKYSDDGKTVQLDIGCAESEMVCVIRDQGIGIPEADREWLFNAFQRGHNVDDRPGTGLGLVIVKRCVDLHVEHGLQLREAEPAIKRVGEHLGSPISEESPCTKFQIHVGGIHVAVANSKGT
jgi:K+-sensing histidine kinase KdpD